MKHAVVLDEKRCRGCTSCIRYCPTEAIRVRGRKATILADRCIDCGRCIHVCPHKAIRSVGDPLARLQDFTYCVALPEPALYAQFHRLDDIDIVLNALLKIGFDAVWEVARASELLADYARQNITAGTIPVKPQISSTCPTVLRLIRTRFPKLIEHVAPTIMPMELAAILARREAVEKTGLPPEQIGVFAIVPCSAKMTAASNPEGLQAPVLDGAFAIRDVYLRLLSPMTEIKDPAPLSSAGLLGVGYAYAGGEGVARLGERCIAVDGISNVTRVLEALEDGRLDDADFVELSACSQGCVGGCFTVEDPFAAKMRMKGLMKGLPVSRNRFRDEDPTPLLRDKELQYLPSFLLDTDLAQAMEKQLKIQTLEAQLPGLQCSSCGAPSCRAFAEDVVMGRASINACIFRAGKRSAIIEEEDGIQ